MENKVRIFAMLCVLTLLGCRSAQPPAAASESTDSTNAAADGNSGAPASSSSNSIEYINDPSLNQNAISVTIPAGWRFHSIFLQGGNCVTTPFPVFRSVSPDGWSMVERMPTMAWQWGTGPMVQYLPKNECLPINGPVNPQNYLQYLTGTMGVHYDGPATVPAWEQQRAQQQMRDAQARFAHQYAASHLTPPKTNRDVARANVTFKIGTHTMKGVLDVTIDCTETQYAGQQQLSAYSPGHPPQLINGQGSTIGKCLASANYYTAPENAIAALLARWDNPSMGAKPVQDWIEAWINRSNQQTLSLIEQMNRAAAQRRQDLANQFAHNMAVQQEMHNQFMQNMQQSHDDFMANQAQNMQARDTAVSDWVDFALDRQTVYNPNTGMINKIPLAVTVEQPLEQAHGNGAPWW